MNVTLKINKLAIEIKVNNVILQDQIIKVGAILILQVNRFVLLKMDKIVFSLLQVGI